MDLEYGPEYNDFRKEVIHFVCVSEICLRCRFYCWRSSMQCQVVDCTQLFLKRAEGIDG